MNRRRFLADHAGAAAAEMALILPFVLVLLFGGLEAGNFIWTHHKLVQGVRDGARFASRIEVQQVCRNGAVILDADRIADIKRITRTGQLTDADARPRIIGWDDAEVSVDVECNAFVDTGIYRELDERGPLVTVSATVPYPSLFGLFGILGPQYRMTAQSRAAVIGL